MKERCTGAQGALEVLAFPLRLLAAIFVCTLLLSGASAQGNSALHESPRAAQVRALNNSILQLHGQVQENAASAGSVRGQAAQVLAQRAAALQALMQENPRAALSFAFSPELLADLAAKFPESTAELESHVTVSGTVEHWIADSADMKSSKESWLLNASGSRLELHFGTPQRPAPSSGPIVTIEGVQFGSHVAVSKVISLTAGAEIPQALGLISNQRPMAVVLLFIGLALATARKLALRVSRPSALVLVRRMAVCAVALLIAVCGPLIAAAQTCSTTGVQNYLIIMVNLPGLTLPSTVTSSSLNTLFFGPAPSVSDYVNEVSYGKASLAGTIVGPYNLTGTYDCSNWMSAIAEDAIAAAANAGANVGNYSRVFIVAPHLSCGFTALSTVGCQTTVTSAGTFNVSYTTAFPDYLFNYSGVYVAAHDGVGHQLGLAHSKLRQYTDSSGTAIPLGALSDPGTITEYGDHYAVMSTYNQGHFAAAHKANSLNWMSAAADYETVNASGTYTIQPLETSSGLRALRIQRGTGNPGYYLWIEYRQPLGNYDSTYNTQGPYMTQVYQGAYIHYEDSTTLNGTHLLDFTAPVAYNENPALVPGQTWSDPFTDLSISILSATGTGLTVSVNYSGASSCTHAVPSVTASPLNPSINPGQTASYSVTVTNNDSTACAASTFGISSSEPSGWSTSFSSSAPTLNPGQSVSLTMGKGSPSGTPAGTYAVNLTASNSAASSTDTANATVVIPPSLAVTLSVSGANFVLPGSVPLSATVVSGGSLASGASVTFKVVAPNGNTTTQTTSTGSNGVAMWNYKLTSRSQIGIYSVVASAGLNSGGPGGKKTLSATTQTITSNSVSFAVQ